ncbi:MAG: hypothetical protein FWC95_03405 [Defluviitaleaceae bacterium]|nr:hypothetical protein [Defluviitaleaceae bacterium]
MPKKIEDIINATLKSNAQKNALDFIAHLQEDEKFSFSKDENDDGKWWIKCYNNLVCEVQIKPADDSPESWNVWVYGDCIGTHDFHVSEALKAIAWKNITTCGDCGAGCAPGRSKNVLGKEFNNICQSTLAFPNPEKDALDCLKKVVTVVKMM